MSERNLNTGPLDESTPPIPIPPAEEGWKQMAARLDVVMPVAGAIGAAAVKGAAVKSGGIALSKLFIGIAAVTSLSVAVVYYAQQWHHAAGKKKTNTTTAWQPGGKQSQAPAAVNDPDSVPGNAGPAIFSNTLTANNKAGATHPPSGGDRLSSPVDVTAPQQINQSPIAPAFADNPAQRALSDEKPAESKQKGNMASFSNAVIKTPGNVGKRPAPVKGLASVASGSQRTTLTNKKTNGKPTVAIGVSDTPDETSADNTSTQLMPPGDEKALADKKQVSPQNKEPQHFPATNPPQVNVASSSEGCEPISTDGITVINLPNNTNAATVRQTGISPAAPNIRDLLTPIAANGLYEHKVLQAPAEVINRLFSFRPPRKGNGMSWEILVQWNLPVTGSNWLKGPTGNAQAYTLLIPGIRLLYGSPDAAVSLDLNAVATQHYNSATYKPKSNSSSSSIGSGLPTSDKYKLLKSYGYSATIAYQHRIYNRWYGAAGIQAFYAREGAISYTRRFDSTNLLIDSTNLLTKYNRYGDKTNIWQSLGRLHLSATAEGFYSHNRWQVGGRVQIPVFMKTDSLTSNIKAQIQAEILLRVKIYKKK